jgi:hypothetical protein
VSDTTRPAQAHNRGRAVSSRAAQWPCIAVKLLVVCGLTAAQLGT